LNTLFADDKPQGVSKMSQQHLECDKNTTYHIEKNALCDIPATVT